MVKAWPYMHMARSEIKMGLTRSTSDSLALAG